MRKILLALFALFTVIAYAAPAYAVTDHCPRQQVKTELKAKRFKTRFMHGTLRNINDYAQSHNVLAFVENPLSIEPYYKFSYKDIGNGKICVMLEEVKVYYISQPRIVMPKNFRKKSCEYKIILQHEQRHLNVHYKYFDQSVKDYAAFLGRVARNVPVSVPVGVRKKEDIAEMQNYIQKYFEDKFAEQVIKSIGEMRAQQEKIDSPQEYTFTNRKIDRCQELEEKKKRQNKKTFHKHSLK